MLRVEGVSVRYGGLLALNDVGLTVDAGRITGLIGPNGAGKTTLFNVVTGLQRPTSGRVLLGDRDITRASPRRRARVGLGRTFQRLEVFGGLTVRENVLVAAEVHGGWTARRTAARRTDDMLERLGLGAVAARPADVLPTGQARLVEVARALAGEPSVLLLDEVSSGLSVSETRALGELLTELADAGMAVLLVEHDMALVMAICTQLYVLDFGELICSGSPVHVQADPRVQAAYLGSMPPTVVEQRLPTVEAGP